MARMIQKSLDDEGFRYEIYLLVSTIGTEIFAYFALLYSVMNRKSLSGWVKIEAALDLETEYQQVDPEILNSIRREIRINNITESLLDSELISDRQH